MSNFVTKTFLIILVFIVFLFSFIYSETETITCTIYADNYFEFFVNGKEIKKDPLDFTPHNAVRFTFDANKGEKRVYAIKASDYASESGYEYIKTNQPQLGDGALRVYLSDGTVSNKQWRCFTTSFGPTDESISAGCSASNLNVCKLKKVDEPENWKELNFDDSKWNNPKEYTVEEAGWGQTPNYTGGKCGPITDNQTRQQKNPAYIQTLADECLDPKGQNWGNSKFIWQWDLNRDNTILCRIVKDSSNITVTNFIQNSQNFLKINPKIIFLMIIYIIF